MSQRSLSKIDRLLENDLFLFLWESACIRILPRLYLDHNTIILISEVVHYSFIPFRFFNSWINLDGLCDIVSLSWAKNIDNKMKNMKLLKNDKGLKMT